MSEILKRAGLLGELLDRNRAWADRVQQENPDFFPELARQQAPRVFWIGCSDSRVPATQIVDVQPGEIFVHRNVANVVDHTDLNCLSAMQFAVEVLKVEHVIVCGHYGCGGVKAALEGARMGLIDNWLQHVQDVKRDYADRLGELPESKRLDRLCELNVLAQAWHVCHTTIIQDAWQRGQNVQIHGWIYGLQDGRISDLAFRVDGNRDADAAAHEAVERLFQG